MKGHATYAGPELTVMLASTSEEDVLRSVRQWECRFSGIRSKWHAMGTCSIQISNFEVAESYPGAGIAHDGNEAVQQHHGHGEDKEQQQDDANDGIVAVVEEVQVCASQHDGKQGHKGMQDVAELLQCRQNNCQHLAL